MDVRIKKVTADSFEEFYKLFSKLIKTRFPEYSKRTLDWLISNPRGHNKERTRK